VNKKILAILIVVGSLFVSGCGFVFVARSRPNTPGYCYDCHQRPRWHRVHTRCAHYEILVVDGGYRYRPHHHRKHQEYKYAKFDHSRDREKREKKEKQKETRDEKEKDKRSRR
jgi:hypothetical protein